MDDKSVIKESVFYAIIITFNPEIIMLNNEYASIVKQVDGIIYVDNFSENKEEIQKWHIDKDKIKIIWLNENKGLGVAQNIGIKSAFELGATHIILFDQDSVIDDGFVSALYKAETRAIIEGHNVGLTGPIYQSYNDGYTYPILSIENNKFKEIPIESFEEYVHVSHIIASGALIKKEAYKTIGPLQEDYFIGYIDHEYAFRAAKNGYEVIVAKTACMKHQMGDSQIKIFGKKIGLYSPFRRYFDCRNTILIQKSQYFPKVYKRHYLKLVFAKVVISLVFGPKRLRQIQYCFKGFIDGIRNISGNCTV